MKTLLILFSIILATALMGSTARINYDIDRDMTAGNFENYHDNAGHIVMYRTIILEGRHQIHSVDAKYSSDIHTGKTPYLNAQPFYSLNNRTHFNESPSAHHEILSTGYSGSNTIIEIALFPFISRDSVTYSISKCEVIIDYSSTDREIPRSRLELPVNSPNATVIENKSKGTLSSTLDMIIVTESNYMDAFDSFIRLNQLMGLRVAIVTTDYIYSHYSGADRPERIRNYLKEQYFSKGVRFVLIGGDVEIVPVRMGYNNNYLYEGYVPTDLYYSDMDGDWNEDNDNIIGEFSVDIIDGYPDIAVSRIPFSNISELNTMLDKFRQYIFNNNPDNIQDMLLAGSSLTSGLTDGHGQKMSDKISYLENMQKMNSYKIYSPIEDTFRDTPWWEKGDEQLSVYSFSAHLNSGYYAVNHVDHSHRFWMGMGMHETETEFFSSDTSMLNNNSGTYSIMFSLGCSPNAFDSESVSEALIKSPRSGITSYTGFTRTGWTHAESIMDNFWNILFDGNTHYFGQALPPALNNRYLYFRAAINTLGFVSLPVFHSGINKLYADIPDTFNNSQSLNIQVNDGSYNVHNAIVTIIDNDNIYRDSTDLSGTAVFNHSFSDSIIIVGIYYSSSVPLIDTIRIVQMAPVSLDSAYFDYSQSEAVFTITNKSNYSIDSMSVNISLSDSLLQIDTGSIVESLSSAETVQIRLPADNYKAPLYNKQITGEGLFSIDGSGYKLPFSIDITPDNISMGSFVIGSGTRPGNIDTLAIINNSTHNLPACTISLTADSFTVTDSLFYADIAAGDTLIITDIRTRAKNYNELSLSNYELSIQANNRAYNYSFNGIRESVMISADVSSDGIKIFKDNSKVRGLIYRATSLKGAYTLIDSIPYSTAYVMDRDISSRTLYYRFEMYDITGRKVDYNDTITINPLFSVSRSATKLSGFFYGSINSSRLYASGSFNTGDIDNDSEDEIIAVSGDGYLRIFNNEMKDITPFTVKSARFSENSPAVGNLDNNNEDDIVMAGGFQSDTTAIIVMNALSGNSSTLTIEDYGYLIASPVIADVNNDSIYEILLGTIKGFFVFDNYGNILEEYSYYTRNITAISFISDESIIVFADYYGTIYSLDSLGNMRTGFPYKSGQVILAPFITGDINNDRLTEIVFGTASGSVFSIDTDGTPTEGFPYTNTGPVYQSPRISDLDNNGEPEIVVFDINGLLSVINSDGTAYGDFQITESGYQTYNEPLLADINNSGTQEIIIASRSGYIHILDNELKLLHNPYKLTDRITSTPLINVDENNNISIIARSLNGDIYKLDYLGNSQSTKTDPDIACSKTMMDSRNTSYVPHSIISKIRPVDRQENEINSKNGFSIDRNIISEGLNIRYSLSGKSDAIVSIYNKLGMLVLTKALNQSKQADHINLRSHGLASGQYFAVMRTSDFSQQYKFTFIK
ncbi:MAG: C25 family cysteine peptidase [bacterium]